MKIITKLLVGSTFVLSAANTLAQLPPLPGPSLAVPVDVDGDGVASFADQYLFNDWLSMGGSLSLALSQGKPAGDILDLSDFFTSPLVALSPDAPVTMSQSVAEVPSEMGMLQLGGCDVEFTRRIPNGTPLQPSLDARITPDGRFIVFSGVSHPTYLLEWQCLVSNQT